jgi:hypothetical protein
MKKVGTKEIKEDDPKVKETPGRMTITLGEYRDRLPVGILQGGKLYKDVILKPWRTKDERELGKKFPNDAGMAEHVSIVVANMCSKLGPHDMDSMKDAEKSLVVSTMYMADVFYVYTLLRLKSMGKDLKLTITCPTPGCGVEFPYVGNLETIEVSYVEDLDDILWNYDLHDPIDIRKQKVEKFRMAYPKWSVMEEGRGNTNEAEVKAMTLLGSIVGLNDVNEPVSLTMSEIDELSKVDFECLIQGINDHFLGPKMGIEGECTPEICTKLKRGGHKFIFPIDWRYKNFFGSSSR